MIPKVIHKVLLDRVTPKPLSSFIAANPDYEVKVYNLEDCEEYILENFSEKTLKLFQKVKTFPFKVDFFVALVLYNEGGWYSSLDQYAVEPIDNIAKTGHKFYVVNSDHGLCTNFIGCEPKHKVFKKLTELINFNVKWNHYGTDPLRVMGTNAFMECLVDFIDESFYFGKLEKEGFIVFNGEAIVKDGQDLYAEDLSEWSNKKLYDLS